MNAIVRLVVAVLFAAALAAPGSAGQLVGPAGQRPIGQAAPGSRAAEMARDATVTILCQGGPGLSIDNRGQSQSGSAARDMVTLSLSFRHANRPAGSDGRALEPGTCSIIDRVMAPMDPARIQFDISSNAQIKQTLHDGKVDSSPMAAERYPDARTIQAYLADSRHYWRFEAVRSGGYFNATANQPFLGNTLVAQSPVSDRSEALALRNPGMADPRNPMFAGAGPAPDQRSKASLPGNLFQMDDRAIIVIGGKQVAAGDVKRELLQNMERPSEPVKTFTVPARQGLPQLPSATTTLSATGPSPMLQRAEGSLIERQTAAATADCSRGPITGRLQGRIAPGERFTVSGACFGNQTGAIELIGQFPGGTLRLDFFGWKDSEIIVATPLVRGVPDHVASLTVIRPDGKRSITRPVTFVAARERVEVPPSLWSPSSHYKWNGVATDGYDLVMDNIGGSHSTGVGTIPPAAFRLRVNPVCGLESMEAIPRVGAVTDIRGWQNSGPPNEASITVFWRSRQTTTRTKYVVGHETVDVYDIEFDLRAWASCPAGITP